MKSVMLSIKPKYCELIASGQKTIEVRKTKPKVETPFKAYIYCTKGKLALLRDNEDKSERYKFEHWNRAKFHEKCGKTLLNGKVICEFVCDHITTYPYEQLNDGEHIMPFGDLEKTCLDGFEIYNYLGTKDGYGWHISDLVIYDKPKELCEFTSGSSQFTFSKKGALVYKGMTRPPQSWCYVEDEI